MLTLNLYFTKVQTFGNHYKIIIIQGNYNVKQLVSIGHYFLDFNSQSFILVLCRLTMKTQFKVLFKIKKGTAVPR